MAQALLTRYSADPRAQAIGQESRGLPFLQAASATPDLGEAQKGFLRDFLRRADMVKFARFVPMCPRL